MFQGLASKTPQTRYKSYVTANGSVIATQVQTLPTGGSSASALRFEHWDTSGMSYKTSGTSGAIISTYALEGSPAELDPMGGNAGVDNPYDDPPPTQTQFQYNLNRDHPLYGGGPRTLCGDLPWWYCTLGLRTGSLSPAPGWNDVDLAPYGYWRDYDDPRSDGGVVTRFELWGQRYASLPRDAKVIGLDKHKQKISDQLF